MPTDTAEHWAVIATRMSQGAQRRWSSTSSRSPPPRPGATSAPAARSRRASSQCEEFTADDGYFATLVQGARAGGQELRPADGASALAEAVAAASGGLRRARRRPCDARCSPQAPEADACGRERYQLVSRSFLGAAVDLEETYAWGQEELARITAEMEAGGRADQARRDRQGGDRRCSTPTRHTSCTAPTSCKAWMQEQGRRGHRQPGRHALRHPRAGPHDRVPDRPDPDRRHLLHRPERGLHAVRAGCGGRCPRASPSSAPGAS